MVFYQRAALRLVNGTPWSAVDFAPPDAIACGRSDLWVTAAAPERSFFLTADWSCRMDRAAGLRTGVGAGLLHLETRDRIKNQTVVKPGDPLGHPSCWGRHI